MFFTSYEFIGFLVLTVVLYYLVPKKIQPYFLLLVSYLFYLTQGAGCLVYIALITAIAYVSAMAIEHNREKQKRCVQSDESLFCAGNEKTADRKEALKAFKKKQQKIRTRMFTAGVILLLLVLVFAKYLGFLIDNLNGIASLFGSKEPLIAANTLGLIMPMGISFYTLQAIGYLIDVHRENISAERNFFRFALFISFFPQLVQGPISRFEDLSKTLLASHDFDRKNVFYGMQRILWGFFKKMVIADRILIGVGKIMADPVQYNGAYVFFGMLLFSLELYADFSGGIDIAIGAAEMLGIKLTENFDRPYFSKSLKEYWRRWHMSMCNWFRNYLFFPVSTARWMQKFSKFCRNKLGAALGRNLPIYAASFIVWFATGIWHGASWNYVIWGLFNWAVLMTSETLEPKYRSFREKHAFTSSKGWKLFQMCRTFLLISVMNVFDWALSPATLVKSLAGIFTTGNWHIIWDGSFFALGYTLADIVIIALGLLVVLAVSIIRNGGQIRDRIAGLAFGWRYLIWTGLFLAVLLFGTYGIGYDASQFIYNRF
ncbi:MAG: MBOAT family protein [Lachnospiraceae bacterium]|nr:MBOAT family protein [Lachnospiraceae bacterium]